MKTTILSVVLLAFLATTEAEIGMGVLMIWPTARSTALAGAMTALADEADATYFNPAGLAFQTTARADVNHAYWLPGEYRGVYYGSAAGGAPTHLPFLRDHKAFIAGSLTYLDLGEMDIINYQGEYLGHASVWRGAAAAHVATMLTNQLGAGVSLKAARSVHEWSYYDIWPPEPPSGLEQGGNATTVAADVGLTYRPSSRVSLGLAVANLGSHISYRPDYDEPYVADLPRMARLGLCWTPVDDRHFRLNLMPELDKVLVGMFRDTTGTKTLGRKLKEELRDVWKAAGIEATAFNIVSFRLGYFEDLTNQRGGLVFEQEDETYHYGVYDVLVRKNLGRFKSIGLCWGFGFGSDKLRFDVSSDAAIYDFPTSNWKFTLVSNDLAGLAGGLR